MFYRVHERSLSAQPFVAKEHNAQDCLEFGITYYRLKNYPEAIILFEEYLRLSKGSAKFSPENIKKANYYCGKAYQELGNFTKALEYYNKALALFPNDFFVLNARGIAQSYLKNYEAAIMDFDKILSLPSDFENSQFATVYYNRGKVELEQGFTLKAFFTFNHALTFASHLKAQRYFNEIPRETLLAEIKILPEPERRHLLMQCQSPNTVLGKKMRMKEKLWDFFKDEFLSHIELLLKAYTNPEQSLANDLQLLETFLGNPASIELQDFSSHNKPKI